MLETRPVSEHEGERLVPHSLRADLVRSPLVLYGGIAAVMLVAWLPASGAYPPAVFCAGAIGILVLVVASVLSGAPVERLGRSHLAALGAAVAFAAWNYASIAWARDQGAAFDGANRTLLYAALFALFAITPWTPRLASTTVALLAAGIAAIGFVGFATTSRSAHPQSSFISGRFTSIVGYENASAALLAFAALSALVLAGRRETPRLLRVVAFMTAAAAADVAVVTESRGAVLGTAGALVVLLLLPGRARALLAAGATAGAVAIAAPALLHVYSASDHGFSAFSHALRHSFTVSCVSVAVAAGIGLAWVAVESLVPAVPRVDRIADRVVLGFVLAALLAPGVFAAARPHTAGHAVRSAWHSFSRNGSPTGTSTRFTSLGSNRYDAYRVSFDEFRAHPIQGIGSDNFAVQYLEHRRSDEELLYPHSDALRIPLQTGVVGVLLALAFLGAFLLGLRRAWRISPAVTALLVVPIVYWSIHASVDWLWEVAGATAPVAAAAGMLFGLVPAPVAAPARRRRLSTAGVVALALVAAVPLGSDWLSSRITNQALGRWRSNPSGALSQLDQASGLNPFSAVPDLYAAAIAARVDRTGAMAAALRRAAKREPSNWYTHLLLAVGDAGARRWSAAAAEAATASRLNPREPTVAEVARAVRSHRKPDLTALNDVYLQRAQKRVNSGVVR